MNNSDITILYVYAQLDKIFSFIIDGSEVKDKKIFKTGINVIDREEEKKFMDYARNLNLTVSISGKLNPAFKKVRSTIFRGIQTGGLAGEAKKYKGWVKLNKTNIHLLESSFAKDFIGRLKGSINTDLFGKINGGRGMPWPRLNSEWEIYRVNKDNCVVISIDKYESKAFFKNRGKIKKIENRELGWYDTSETYLQDKIIAFCQFVINQVQFENGSNDCKVLIYQTENKQQTKREKRVYKTHMEYLLTNELPVESVEYNFDFCDLETQLEWSIRQITNRL